MTETADVKHLVVGNGQHWAGPLWGNSPYTEFPPVIPFLPFTNLH